MNQTVEYYKEQLAAKEDMLARTSAYLSEAQERLRKKNKELQIANEEIYESIRFAELIQTSFLPNLSVLKVFLSDADFFVHQQMGIGGDLIFSKNTGTGVLFGLFDSTGHGIPASLLSIAGSLIMQEITSSMQIDSPATLIKLLNYQLHSTFNRNEYSLAHMEGTIFYYCARNSKLTYSSAKGKNIFIPKNGEVYELISSRGSVGQNLESDFAEFELTFEKGDKLLMYSDGLIDQFGGELNKKFNRKRLIELVKENKHKCLAELKSTIETAHKNWKGTTPQTDDVSFMIIEL